MSKLRPQWRTQDFPTGGGGGGAPTPKVGVLTYYFCRKQHENKKKLQPLTLNFLIVRPSKGMSVKEKFCRVSYETSFSRKSMFNDNHTTIVRTSSEVL